MKLSQDGSRLALYYTHLEQPIEVFDTKTGELIKTLVGHDLKVENMRGYSGISKVVFSPDNQFLYTSSYDTTIKYWNLKTGRCVITLHPSCSRCELTIISISPDGTKIVVSETSQIGDHLHEDRIKVFSTQTGTLEFEKTLDDLYWYFVEWSHDSRQLSVGMGQNSTSTYVLNTYATTDGSKMSTFSTNTLATLEKERYLHIPRCPNAISLEKKDGLMIGTHLGSGKEIFRTKGRNNYTFNQDFTRLALESENGKVNIWNIQVNE